MAIFNMVGGGGGTPVVKCGTVDYLLVGGGGAAETSIINCPFSALVGGGGGGGFIEKFCQCVELGYIDIVIGEGGLSGKSLRCNGGNSSFNGDIAYGGGKGGISASNSQHGTGGGSGGGGAGYYCCYGGGGDGGSACSGQGYKGGNAYKNTSCAFAQGPGGGGGGAGGAGSNGGSSVGGAGGVGKASSISGTSVCYAGGGGGMGYSYTDSSVAGLNNGIGQCGGGGGGKCSNGCPAPNSGNPGVVIIRYHTDGSDGICSTKSLGGIKYTSGDFTIHCFTSIGNHGIYLAPTE